MTEHSSAIPTATVPLWPFKTLIPIVGVLMVLQGIVEVIRCIMCIRTGEWPQRLHDVEELEKIILERGAGECRRPRTREGRSDVRHRPIPSSAC